MDMKSAIVKLLDRLQTFRCASCGEEIKLLHTLDPTQGFYIVSRKTNKAYYQSLLLFLLNPEESTLVKFKDDESLENIFQLNTDGTFKHFYILCKDCFTGEKPVELEFFKDLDLIFRGGIDEDIEQADFVDEEYEKEEDESEESRLTSCKNCGSMISKRAKRCPRCGMAVERSVICEDCGAEVPADADECPECGGPLDNTF